MVDLIHGQWASNGSGGRQRIATTFHNLLNVSQALLSGASPEASWHDMSLARRILPCAARRHATAHRHAVKHSSQKFMWTTSEGLPRYIMISIPESSLTATASNNVWLSRKNHLRLHWDDLAVVYEACPASSKQIFVRALSGVTKIRDAIQQNALTVHPLT